MRFAVVKGVPNATSVEGAEHSPSVRLDCNVHSQEDTREATAVAQRSTITPIDRSFSYTTPCIAEQGFLVFRRPTVGDHDTAHSGRLI